MAHWPIEKHRSRHHVQCVHNRAERGEIQIISQSRFLGEDSIRGWNYSSSRNTYLPWLRAVVRSSWRTAGDWCSD